MHTAARLIAALFFAASSIALAGCNIVGPAVVFLSPPPTVDAAFKLDPDKPTVLFIDDRGNKLPRRALRQIMAEEAEKNLLAEEAVKDMISFRSALTAAAGERHGEPMAIADIGRAVGAKQIIYVTIDDFRLSPDGSTYSPLARMRAKVIDVEKNTRIFPTEDRGHPLGFQNRPRQGLAPTAMSEINAAEARLAREAGLGIAQLFYKHQVDKAAGRDQD